MWQHSSCPFTKTSPVRFSMKKEIQQMPIPFNYSLPEDALPRKLWEHLKNQMTFSSIAQCGNIPLVRSLSDSITEYSFLCVASVCFSEFKQDIMVEAGGFTKTPTICTEPLTITTD